MSMYAVTGTDGKGYIVSARNGQAAVEHIRKVEARQEFLTTNAEEIRAKAAEIRARRAAARAAR